MGPNVDGVTAPADAPFLAACRREPTPYTPVWFMRQAGRSLPEYRAVRGEGSILDAIAKPELAAEITMQPVRRHRVDAAVLYSDIVVPVAAIGFGVDVAPGTGPVIDRPFASSADLDRLRPLEPELDTPYVLETVRILAAELAVPLIGFAGAPFTVASYLVEGGPSRRYARTKALMYGDEPLWHALLDRLADLSATSLVSQVRAGAQAVQLFDSWAGTLHPADYRRYVMPHSAKVLAAVGALGVPRIHFGVETGELLGAMAEAGADVVGASQPAWACKATSIRWRASARGRSCARKRPRSWPATAVARATCSTSATASSPRPTPPSSRGSSRRSTAASCDRRHAVGPRHPTGR